MCSVPLNCLPPPLSLAVLFGTIAAFLGVWISGIVWHHWQECVLCHLALRTCTFLNSFITFYTYFPTFLGLTRALLNTLARCTLLLCNGVMAPDWRISTISHHTVSGGTKCIVHCYIMAVTNWSFNNSACSPVYDTLMCDCIFLGRPRQSFQKINGVQHSHSRGRQCFHPLPGNWSKSGQPAPGNMLQ